MPAGSPLSIIGHRGAMGVEPENTLRSYLRAINDGVDAVELDVRRSLDGELVICHDSTVSRTTNGEGEIHELTLAELKKLDAGEGETIPTLAEALDEIGDVAIQIELKAADALGLIVETVRQRALLDQVILTSFHAKMLEVVRYLLPQARRGLIFGGAPADAVEQAAAVEAGMIAPRISHLSRKLVSDAHQAGLEVCAWPANDADEMRLALLLGVDAVTTDIPSLREVVAG